MKLFILGAGGLAREIYFHIKDINKNIEILFIDDVTPRTEIKFKNETVKVIKTWEEVRTLIPQGFKNFTIGIGDPAHKYDFVKKAFDAGLVPNETWVHPRALVQDASLGRGGIVSPGVLVTTNVSIGDFVVVNLNATIGHDAIVENYCTVNPGASVSGNVALREGVLVGSGAVIKERISVAAQAVIGAQSCVVKNIDELGVVVAGVPAKKLGNS